MGIWKRMREKGKPAQEGPPVPDLTEPLPEREEDLLEERTPALRRPTRKTPLIVSLETLVRDFPLPNSCQEISRELERLSQNPDTGLGEVKHLAKTLGQRIQSLQVEKADWIQQAEEQQELRQALETLADLGQQSANFATALPEEALPQQENYETAGSLTHFAALNKLFSQLEENWAELALSPALEEDLLALGEDRRELERQHRLLCEQIHSFQEKRKELEDGVARFAQTVNRVKAMGQGGMQQYYDQLAQAQAQLKEQRETLLREEGKLNAYIPSLYRAVCHFLESFCPFAPLVEKALGRYRQSLEEEHMLLLQRDLSPGFLAQQEEEARLLKALGSGLEDCIQLHAAFAAPGGEERDLP